MNKTLYQFVYLLSCAANLATPDMSELEEVNYKKVLSLAKYHSLTSFLADVISKTDAPDEIKKYFSEVRIAMLRKSLIFDSERSHILSKMDEQGIYYIPLKGIIINHLYPKYGMREFADNDILYDPEKQKALVKIFKENNYKVESIGKGHHDVFLKEPCLNFEMHRILFDEDNKDKAYLYYKDVLKRAIKDEDNKYGYHLNTNDFYLYFLAHAYKHTKESGNGLRYLVDNWFYLKNNEDKMDFDYIKKEAEVIGLADFASTAISLSRKIFSDPKALKNMEFTQTELDALTFSFESGVYGNIKIYTENSLKTLSKENQTEINKNTKFKYIMSRLFPPLSWYKKFHPFLYKTKVFIPFFTIYRLFKGLFSKKSHQELSCVKEFKEK